MMAFRPARFGLVVHFDRFLARNGHLPHNGRIELVLLLMQGAVLVFETQCEGAERAFFAAKILIPQRGRQDPRYIPLAVGSLITVTVYVPGKYTDVVVIVRQSVFAL